MSERTVRVGAIGDLHFDEHARGTLTELFDRVNREADVLALVGDLTTHGNPRQMAAFIEEMETLRVPVVTVLGNHDYEHDAADELCEMLTSAGVAVLDGNGVVVEGVGFTGVKGFGGGFGRRALGPFGEDLIKAFVQEALDEALKLERGLHELHTEEKVVLLHYAPIPETLEGEPLEIFPFLGSSRLLDPLETLQPDVIFHGHAHYGRYRAETPRGIPVLNVARQVLDAAGVALHIHEAKAPDRRDSGSDTTGSTGKPNGDGSRTRASGPEASGSPASGAR